MIPAPVSKAAPAATDAQAAPATIDPVTAYDRRVREMILDGQRVCANPFVHALASRFVSTGSRRVYRALIGAVGHEAANHSIVFASTDW